MGIMLINCKQIPHVTCNLSQKMKRIAKHLSELGIMSRRAAEQAIADGRIKLNEQPVTTPVTFVTESDKITIDEKAITKTNPKDSSSLRRQGPTANQTTDGPVLYLFHKPTGCLTTSSDPLGRKTIYDILPPAYKNLKYIGRLDYNTSGLLLLTNDGTLAREMTLPSAGLERTYIAKLGRAMSMDDSIFARKIAPARKGIKIDGIIYRPMKIERIDGSDVKVTITEGKKNEIRIVFEHLGLPVRKLHRISYGPYKLGTLKPGQIVLVLIK